MDTEDLHEAFRELVKQRVIYRTTFRSETADSDWAVRCFHSRERFEALFPTRALQREVIKRIREQQKGTEDGLREIARIGKEYLKQQSKQEI